MRLAYVGHRLGNGIVRSDGVCAGTQIVALVACINMYISISEIMMRIELVVWRSYEFHF